MAFGPTGDATCLRLCARLSIPANARACPHIKPSRRPFRLSALCSNQVEQLRPEYQHGWGSKTYYTQLRLDPLPPVSAEEFLQAILGDDPSLEPLKQLLIARTEGNPFFLEESVRTLAETGVLEGERGAYHLGQA